MGAGRWGAKRAAENQVWGGPGRTEPRQRPMFGWEQRGGRDSRGATWRLSLAVPLPSSGPTAHALRGCSPRQSSAPPSPGPAVVWALPAPPQGFTDVSPKGLCRGHLSTCCSGDTNGPSHTEHRGRRTPRRAECSVRTGPGAAPQGQTVAGEGAQEQGQRGWVSSVRVTAPGPAASDGPRPPSRLSAGL